MVIHSIISMNDIFFQSDYPNQTKILKKQDESDFYELNIVNDNIISKDVFLTNPSAYLKTNSKYGINL